MIDPAACGASRIKLNRNPHLKYMSSGVQRPKNDLCQVMALPKLAGKKKKYKKKYTIITQWVNASRRRWD
jgi:hypothetical protein